MKRTPARRRELTVAELREIIPPIPDAQENIARACLRTPAKKHWRFLEKKLQPVGGSD